MAFQITPGVEVERDTAGAVRSLQHVTVPYTPVGAVALNASSVAEVYLRDVASIYGFDPALLAALDTPPSDQIIAEATQLHLVGAQRALGATTVSYQQTHFGLPVWEAGFSVQLLNQPMRVVGSQATTHGQVAVKRPPDDAQCMPERITARSLQKLLPGGEKQEITAINGKRLWIYLYDAKRRTGREDNMPSVPLGHVPDRIHDGGHFVVTEVLFTMPLPKWPDLHWQALVEVETCAILYLRPLVEDVTGTVYLTDPPSATGDATITACSPASKLDPLRTDVSVDDLTAATPQGLTGSYVTIVDDSNPPKTPPTISSPATDFGYSAVDPNFAAVNAYYHVDELFRLIESFGYSPISTFFGGTTFPVPVYYFDETDVNAHTYPNGTNTGLGKLTFGYVQQSGGGFCPVGMAADWRITMHEFVHGMLADRIHNLRLGFAHNGGDGFGAIYMAPTSLAPDPGLTFPWVPAIPRRIDRSVALGWAWGGTQDDHDYNSEEILATTLFRIYRSTSGDSSYLPNRQFGSRYMLYVMTHAMASLPLATTTPTTATSYAQALINADAGAPAFQGVPGGTIGKVIRWSFEKQGLYQPAGAPTPVTTPGSPPAIDVYVNDAFNGEYPYVDSFWENVNIWNLLAPNPVTTPADHQTPIVGQTNYAYVLISNRGTQAASNITVFGYHCKPSAGLLWPDDWQAMTTPSINVSGPLAPNSSKLVGPFEWTPSEVGHECMLMVVSTSGDISNADAASGLPCATGPTPHWRLVPFDNNIGQRNVAPVAGGGGVQGLVASFGPRRFWLNNPYEGQEPVKLEVLIPVFLARRDWTVEFLNPGGAAFTLSGRGSREIVFRLRPGADFTVEDVHVAGSDTRIVVRAIIGGALVGGMTYQIDPTLKTPPPEHKPRKRPDCAEEARELLECLHVPTDEVCAVHIKRITVEIDLKSDC